MFGSREHTADLIVWSHAQSADACLEQLALALREVVTGRATLPGMPDKELTFTVQAPDDGALVVAFLSELLWLLESEDALWHSGGVTYEEGQITAHANVVTYDPAKHGQGVEVKAVTYHDLQFVCKNDGWHSSVLLDI